MYHVTYGTIKKIVEKRENESIFTKIRKTFNIPEEFNIQLNKWDSDWDDWITVESDKELPQKGKLQIDCVLSEINMSPVVTKEFKNYTDINSSSSVLNTSNTCDYEYADLPGKVKFTVPTKLLTSSMIAALERGGRLGKSQRSYLLNVIFDEMSKVTLNPTRGQYRNMAELLIKEFPALATGLSFTDAVSLWRTAISDKFRNERKSMRAKGFLKQPLNSMKVSSTSDEKSEVSNTWGIPRENFLPPRFQGENDVSIAAHVKWLQSENLKTVQDLSSIRIKMDITFPERRRMVIEEKASVACIKEAYPILFREDEMILELSRLIGIDIEETFMVNLKRYGPTIFKEGILSSFGKEVQSLILANDDPIVRETIGANAVPLQLVMLSGEKLSDFIADKNSQKDEKQEESSQKKADVKATEAFPKILYEGEQMLDFQKTKYEIFIGEEKICVVRDVVRAVLCLFATHYLFSISYPKQLRTSFKLIQHLLCGIPDTAAKSKKFLRILNAISVTHRESKIL